MYSTIVTILLVIFVILYFVTRKNARSLAIDGVKKLAAADTRYALLVRKYEKSEEGIAEICENYENDALSLNDKIEAYREVGVQKELLLRNAEEIIEHHAVHCHGIVEDTVELIMERLRPTHTDEEPEGVASDG